MAQLVTVNLLGKSYELKDDRSEIDLKKVARFVESRARAIEKEHPKLPPMRAMVLLAMSLGAELMKAESQLESLRKNINVRLSTISEKIDSHMVEKID